MTSEQIDEIRRGSPADYVGRDGSTWWLQEIAYQLAVFNERNAKPSHGINPSSDVHILDWLSGIAVNGSANGATVLRDDEVRELFEEIHRRATKERKKAQGELDAANQHVKILENRVRLQQSGLAPILRSCAQTIMENRLEGPSAVSYLMQYADSVAGTERSQPAPPSSAACPVCRSLRCSCAEPDICPACRHFKSCCQCPPPPQQDASGSETSSQSLRDILDDHAPPLIGSTFRHLFAKVEGNRFCGACGGGQVHPIHLGGVHERMRASDLMRKTDREQS